MRLTYTGGGLGGPLPAGLTRGAVVPDQSVALVTDEVDRVRVGEVYPSNTAILHCVGESAFYRCWCIKKKYVVKAPSLV